MGGLFRVSQYLSNRSFWHDEAFLVLNIQDKTAGQLLGPLMLALAVLGGMSWYRDRKLALLGTCVLPIGLVILAACARKYPFGGSRVTVFLLPGVFLRAATGLEHLRLHLPAQHRWWWAVVPFLVIGLANGAR